MRLVALIALLVSAAALAGCSSKPSPAPEDDLPDQGLVATDETGIIRGVVVDDAIRPIAGALVTVRTSGSDAMSMETMADGLFGFDGLAPGDYFVAGHKIGHFDIQQSETVVAGVADPTPVTLRLAIDPGNQPYFQDYVYDGFIQCAGTFVAVGANMCTFTDEVDENLTDDRFYVEYELDRKPTWVQSEMIWDSSQAAGDAMSIMYSWECDDNDGFLCDHDVGGTSPLLLTADATAIEKIGGGDLGEGVDLFIRVFNQGLNETDTDPGGGVGATIQQSFMVYTHVFYGYAPPEGWRFSEDENVPKP